MATLTLELLTVDGASAFGDGYVVLPVPICSYLAYLLRSLRQQIVAAAVVGQDRGTIGDESIAQGLDYRASKPLRLWRTL